MIRTPNRLRSGERGAVGMMIIMWLAVVVLLGIAAIDAGSIAFTKFRLADVASTASTAAANAFRTSPNTVTACQAAEASIAAEDPSAKLGQEGVRHQRPDEHRDDHGPQGSEHDHREPRGPDEEVHQGERHGDQRTDRPVALSRVTGPEPDEALVRRYLAGDERAFSMLVERHQTRVFNVALRVLGDRDDARDAAQDAFLSMLRKLSQFRGDAAFTTWMHRITVNSCYDILRKRRRQPMLRLVGDEDDPIPETGPPVADHADATVDSDRRRAGAAPDPRGVPRDVGPGRHPGRRVRGDRPCPGRSHRDRQVPGAPRDGSRWPGRWAWMAPNGNRPPLPGRRRESHDASRRAPRRIRRRHPVRTGTGRRRDARVRMLEVQPGDRDGLECSVGAPRPRRGAGAGGHRLAGDPGGLGPSRGTRRRRDPSLVSRRWARGGGRRRAPGVHAGPAAHRTERRLRAAATSESSAQQQATPRPAS